MFDFRRTAAAAALILGITACGDNDAEFVDAGLLTVDWSISSSIDPVLCNAYGARDMELVIYDVFGGFVVEVEEPCEFFTVTVDLVEGTYDAEATLVDGFDRSVTETRVLTDLVIVGDTELVVDVNYPPGSIL